MEDKQSMHLKEWLITQIESGNYTGLTWEDEGKSMFRIPWKHAAKQDYNQSEDAALFKAWAIYKGKYREGRDKPDPSVWKTRMRCALNKSTDFTEVSERSQLDISEPYKVYRILDNSSSQADSEMKPVSKSTKNDLTHEVQIADHQVGANQGPGFATRGLFGMHCCLQVQIFYQGQMVKEFISRGQEGCFILHGASPVGNECIYGPCGAQQVLFPPVEGVNMSPGLASAMRELLPHLDRGVLVWVACEGVFIKRFCQGRVYWQGPLSVDQEQPNKLQRQTTYKLMDMNVFHNELQLYRRGEGPRPRYKIDLCFGEEYPESGVPKTQKLIMAQVVPLYPKELTDMVEQNREQEHHLS